MATSTVTQTVIERLDLIEEKLDKLVSFVDKIETSLEQMEPMMQRIAPVMEMFNGAAITVPNSMDNVNVLGANSGETNY